MELKIKAHSSRLQVFLLIMHVTSLNILNFSYLKSHGRKKEKKEGNEKDYFLFQIFYFRAKVLILFFIF